uniref:Uncharacterized protein n=1 Tax=Arundo donax TaxID=35708 RepID=A0A0A8YKD8_ARUDO
MASSNLVVFLPLVSS